MGRLAAVPGACASQERYQGIVFIQIFYFSAACICRWCYFGDMSYLIHPPNNSPEPPPIDATSPHSRLTDMAARLSFVRRKLGVAKAMNTSPVIQRPSRWHILAAITIVIHVSIYLSPIPIVALRSGDPGIRQYLLLLVPAIWTIFIYLRYRHSSERVVAYCSLIMTVGWFLFVGSLRA